MQDEQYIVELMRTESDALGFIPVPALRDRILRHGRYLIQRDHAGHRRGYLLHGPPLAGQPLRVYQCVIDIDHRRIYYATRMLDALIDRASRAGSTEILIRCATDLDATQFWRAIGARLLTITQGGQRRNRWIATYSLPVEPWRPLLTRIPHRQPPLKRPSNASLRSRAPAK